MANNFESTGNVIKSAAALIALFPGLAIIFGLVDIPPTLADLVKVISFSVSVIVLIAVFLLRDRIVAMSNERAAIIGVIAVLIGAASLTFYYRFADKHTVVIPIPSTQEVERHIIPLNPSREILDRVAIYSGDYDETLRMHPDAELLKDEMKDQAGSAVIIMILLLVLSQLFLIAPVVAAAWKLVGAPALGEDGAAARPAAPAPPAPPKPPET